MADPAGLRTFMKNCPSSVSIIKDAYGIGRNKVYSSADCLVSRTEEPGVVAVRLGVEIETKLPEGDTALACLFKFVSNDKEERGGVEGLGNNSSHDIQHRVLRLPCAAAMLKEYQCLSTTETCI